MIAACQKSQQPGSLGLSVANSVGNSCGLAVPADNRSVGLTATRAQDFFIASRPQSLGPPHLSRRFVCRLSANHGITPHGGTAGKRNMPSGVRATIHMRGHMEVAVQRTPLLHMQKKPGRAATKPHEDRRCLQCHVGVELDAELDKKLPPFAPTA